MGEDLLLGTLEATEERGAGDPHLVGEFGRRVLAGHREVAAVECEFEGLALFLGETVESGLVLFGGVRIVNYPLDVDVDVLLEASDS